MTEPVHISQAVADVLSQLAGRTLPTPCPHCGWQYPPETLLAAVRGEVTLDPQPTHLCQPPLV